MEFGGVEWEAARWSAPRHRGDVGFAHGHLEFTRTPPRRTDDEVEVAPRNANSRYDWADVAASGFPFAERVMLKLVGTSEDRCNNRYRQHHFESWRDDLWRRTFGHADPEDPTTW